MLTPGVNWVSEKEYIKNGMERWLTQSPQASLRLRQWWFPLCEQYSNGRSNNFKINTEWCISGLTPGPSSFLRADSEGCKLDTQGSDDRWNQNSEWKWTDGCVKESAHTFIRCHRHLCEHIKTYQMKQDCVIGYFMLQEYLRFSNMESIWSLHKELGNYNIFKVTDPLNH